MADLPDGLGDVVPSARTYRLSRLTGSPRFLLAQSGVILAWVAYNIAAELTYVGSHPHCLTGAAGAARYADLPGCAGGPRPFDPYPFALLVLALSLQAAYAAPLVLVGQNITKRMDAQRDFEDAQSRQAVTSDVQYLTSELGRVRSLLGEALTRDAYVSEIAAWRRARL